MLLNTQALGQPLLCSLLLTGLSVTLITQPVKADVTQVIGVRIERLATGLRVILETSADPSPQVFSSRYDQTLLIDILNAQLNLAETDEFYQENPAPGITLITVAPLYNNSIRVTVKGENALPIAEVVQRQQEISFRLPNS